jgi:succinate-semialdehyde dehydrogenase / glutarate-semialdehyde dehydrogenase
MKAINPATEELIRDYAEPSEAEIEDRLQRAQHAFSSWRTTSFADRSRLMERAAQLLRERRTGYARLMT